MLATLESNHAKPSTFTKLICLHAQGLYVFRTGVAPPHSDI